MRIIICGDFTTSGRGLSAVNTKTAVETSVCKIIKEHDIAIVNLEAPVSPKGARAIDKHGPCLKTTPETIFYLKECGFGCVTLANNHFYDYGEAGVMATIHALEKNDVSRMGGGEKDKDKRSPFIVRGGDSNVCILNYCESEFSVGHEMGSNGLDPIKAYYDIKKAVKNQLFVVVIVHGGHEGYQLPSPRMKQLYRFFINCGANVVINHHQHCYSGYERYQSGMIFYGLGNFFFDKLSSKVSTEWFEGYMVSLSVEENGLADFTIYPYNQCKNDCVEVRLMKDDELVHFNQQIKHLNKIIADDALLEQLFGEFADSQEKNYLLRFTPYTIGKIMEAYRKGLLPSFINKKKKIRILNAISCEAHRDICMYLLKKYLNTK